MEKQACAYLFGGQLLALLCELLQSLLQLLVLVHDFCPLGLLGRLALLLLRLALGQRLGRLALGSKQIEKRVRRIRGRI